MVTEMSGQGNVQSGKCLSGEMFGHRILHQGSVRSGICPLGSVSWGNVQLGKYLCTSWKGYGSQMGDIV